MGAIPGDTLDRSQRPEDSHTVILLLVEVGRHLQMGNARSSETLACWLPAPLCPSSHRWCLDTALSRPVTALDNERFTVQWVMLHYAVPVVLVRRCLAREGVWVGKLGSRG